MKRFYKLVTRTAYEDGFAVHLDGKPVKAPSGAVLTAPTQALADALVQEWAAQEEEIVPDSMPLTQILTTAQDRVRQERADIQKSALAYLNTDLICYRTDMPEDLAKRQRDCWDRWTGWFENRYGAPLLTTTGLAALKHDTKAHEAIASEVSAMGDYNFTVLQIVTSLAGSVVLALAFTAREASVDDVFEAANIEETYKAEIYNEAEHGSAPLQEKKQNAMRNELSSARKFLELLDL